jgi:uncharacterized cupin superfamily protein
LPRRRLHPPQSHWLHRPASRAKSALASFAALEPDHLGMHTTDTIDLEVVLAGEVWLELDDGEEVHLKTGDTFVQNGMRHRGTVRGSFC